MATLRQVEQNVVQLQVEVGSIVTQVKRIISDIESEKGTRSRQDERLEEKLDEIDASLREALKELKSSTDENSLTLKKIVWLAGVAVVVIAPFFDKLVDKLAKLAGLE